MRPARSVRPGACPLSVVVLRTAQRRVRVRVLSCVVAGLTALAGMVAPGLSTARASSPAWTMTAAPAPAAAVTAGLVSVSCPTATVCIAVGNTNSTKTGPCSCHGFSEVLNNGTWTVQPFAVDDPLITGGVSCTSVSFCVAVGATLPSVLRTHAVAQVWNGHSWKAMPQPASTRALSSVTCRSSRWCMAVGTVAPQSLGSRCCALAATWNGEQWSTAQLPAPSKSGSEDSELVSVSCASTTFCAAAGRDLEGKGELWFFDGRQWTLRYDGNSADVAAGPVMSVACPSVAGCHVVGGLSSGVSFVTPHRWIMHSAAGGLPVLIAAVSCAAANRCSAVGEVGVAPMHGYVALWNGTRWTEDQPPGPSAGSVDVTLQSVACPTVSRCVAVGELTKYDDPTYEHLLIESRG